MLGMLDIGYISKSNYIAVGQIFWVMCDEL